MSKATSLPTMDAERHSIASDATYEVQVLALMLRSFLVKEQGGADLVAAGRGILTRIADLSDILFEAVIQEDTERHSTEDLRRKLGEVGR